MPNTIVQYKCLLISPSDVIQERDALTDTIQHWNAQVGSGLQASIDLVRWESHSIPDLSKPPQDVINEQLVDECDLGVAVFWSKLGTPTAEHPSGSVEEIMKLVNRQARVLVYFSKKDIPQAALKDDQFAKLMDVKRNFREQGLYSEYADIPNLREQVNLHLTNLISSMLTKTRGASSYIPATGTVVAPTPEVKVVANPGFVSNMNPMNKSTTKTLGVSIANHSPVTVYITNVGFELKTGESLLIQNDFITGESLLKKRQLHSGDSLSFQFDPEKLREYTDRISAATAKDAIGRIYRSVDQDIPAMLRMLLKNPGI